MICLNGFYYLNILWTSKLTNNPFCGWIIFWKNGFENLVVISRQSFTVQLKHGRNICPFKNKFCLKNQFSTITTDFGCEGMLWEGLIKEHQRNLRCSTGYRLLIVVFYFCFYVFIIAPTNLDKKKIYFYLYYYNIFLCFYF